MTDTTTPTTHNRPEAESDTSDDPRTTRDRVWDAALSLLAERPFALEIWRVRKRAGFEHTRSKDRTIRRTLRAMERAGWLEHEAGANRWERGPKAEEVLDAE